MPGQRSARARARGSWALRLAGIGLAVLLAGGGVVAYLVTEPGQDAKHDAGPSVRVASVQTVGLASPGPAGQAGPGTAPELLLAGPRGLTFAPAKPTALPAGFPEWTADQMVGGGYVFIYTSTGRCLAVTPARAAVLQRCDLSDRQRWTREYHSTDATGQNYWQLRNDADGRCLTVGSPVASSGGAAPGARLELQRCGTGGSWRQLIAFWSAY
jgi:Ricin-type beta-trefoil lectin domain-like